jgi:hypothetical protein
MRGDSGRGARLAAHPRYAQGDARTERQLDLCDGVLLCGWSVPHPLFLEPRDAFWSFTKGGPLAYTYVGQIITETTLRELGVAVSPHLLRRLHRGDHRWRPDRNRFGASPTYRSTHNREVLQQRRLDRCGAAIPRDPDQLME